MLLLLVEGAIIEVAETIRIEGLIELVSLALLLAILLLTDEEQEEEIGTVGIGGRGSGGGTTACPFPPPCCGI